MDATGQVYFDEEHVIPQEDKDRLAAEQAKERVRKVNEALDRIAARRYEDGS